MVAQLLSKEYPTLTLAAVVAKVKCPQAFIQFDSENRLYIGII